MKIVHTGDWHVGKTIRGKHRGSEYRSILNELFDFIKTEKIDILLVAGDLFDSPSPSAEAADIVYNFFHKISFLKVKSFVIAGNHDSGLRFEAIANLMALANVQMVGLYDENLEKMIHTIISEDGQEKVNIGMLPFVAERFFIRAQDVAEKERSEITHRYSDGMANLFAKLSDEFPSDGINILMGHLLMHGAKPGGGERRLYLGDNYAVHPTAIPEQVDYFALAHVHMYQKIEAHCPIFYCGSPMQMDFGEVDHEKGFLCMEVKNNDLSAPRFIPFQSGVKLRSIFGTMTDIEQMLEEEPSLLKTHLKITLKTDVASLGLSHKIKQQFPNAVDIRREFITKENREFIQKDNPKWLPDLYQEFHNNNYDRAADPIMLEEFTKLYEQCVTEENDKTEER